jgi:hypothetical protein
MSLGLFAPTLPRVDIGTQRFLVNRTEYKQIHVMVWCRGAGMAYPPRNGTALPVTVFVALVVPIGGLRRAGDLPQLIETGTAAMQLQPDWGVIMTIVDKVNALRSGEQLRKPLWTDSMAFAFLFRGVLHGLPPVSACLPRVD